MARAPRAKGKGAGYKRKGPSKADKVSSEIQSEILEFWKAIGNSDLKGWQRPWVYNMMLAENAGKYLLGDERYVYKGGFNQFIVAFSAKDKDSEYAPLVMTRSDMTQMFFGRQDKLPEGEKPKGFGETPVVTEGHVKSIGSLFKAPYTKKTTTWHYPDGKLWKSDERKSPTSEEIKDLDLKKRVSEKKFFDTFPVWSAEDVRDYLPDEYRQKLDELVELRRGKGYDFNPEDDVEAFIDQQINDVIERQGIKVTEHGNEAFYVPSQDVIQKPKKEQFLNPVVRYAVAMHELAHSTKHITGRLPSSNGDKVLYAKEEIVAESTAVMLVKQLERKLEHALPERPDVRAMFNDYYSNAMTYSKGWGSKFDFLEGVRSVEESMSDDKNAVKAILIDVAKAVDTLNNGEYTPEQRHEFKVKNFERMSPSKTKEKVENTPEESPGMSM